MTSNLNLTSVILAGGSGNRLWPISKDKHPKQFQSFNLDTTLFQKTLRRASKLNSNNLITICNKEHRFLVEEEMNLNQTTGKIILEPIGRNTAPAITLAALSVDQDSLILVMPSDHHIESDTSFLESISSAYDLANQGKIVTFGVVPSSPHTGYGYIKIGDQIDSFHAVDQFIEKPDSTLAEKLLSEGSYLWNCGIFLFKASTFLEEIERYREDILIQCKQSLKSVEETNNIISPDEDSFSKCPSESIDYSVMEHTNLSVVVPLKSKWSDLGSWKSIFEISNKDSNNNLIEGDVIVKDSANNYIYSEEKLVATNGIENLIIVSTKDSVLISDMSASEEVKFIAQDLRHQGRVEADTHREVQRPWGKYDSIDQGIGFQVKRITVKPKSKLSLQKHQYRSEHWTVVAGVAKVTVGEKVFSLTVNESTYIPCEEIHRLENTGTEDLVIIEVQVGSYTGEDDIIRIEDDYDR